MVTIKSTATAASLWATGAIGTAVGLGAYDVGAVIALMSVVSFVALPRLKPDTARDRKDHTPAPDKENVQNGEQ